MKTIKTLFAAGAAVMMAFAAEAAPTAKAFFTDGGAVFRMVYDDKAHPEAYPSEEYVFLVDESSADGSPWDHYLPDIITNAVKIVIDLSFAAYGPKKCSSWFCNFRSVTTIEGLNYINTSMSQNMYGMFLDCKSIKSLDLSHFDTKNVEGMHSMFSGCEALESLDVSLFDTSRVTTMESMFWGCRSLKSLDVSSFDTSSVIDMPLMFAACSSLTSLDLSDFDTRKVDKMNSMFTGCESLTSLDLSSFRTTSVTRMGGMFSGCTSLRSLNLSSFSTQNVWDMSCMFENCPSLRLLDLSGFDTEKVEYMYQMFIGCTALRRIYASSAFKTGVVTASHDMFAGCTALVGGNGTAYDPAVIDKTYARLDLEGQPGYFSVKGALPELFASFVPGDLNPKGATYNGFIGEDSLDGTFTLVIKKPKKGSTSAAATLTKVDAATGKKVKITGMIDINTGVGSGGLAGLLVGAKGVTGSLGGVAVQGAIDAVKAKDSAALAVMDGFNKQVYGLVYDDGSGEEAYLTVTFSAKGKVKVAGSFRGAKVSGKAQMSVGDDFCAVPFVWSKKGVSVTFVLWFKRATRELAAVTGLGDAASLVDAGSAGVPPSGSYRFALTASDLIASVPDMIKETPLETLAAFNGSKFDAGKAAKVSYKKGELSIVGDNVSGLALKYSKGSLTGSFTIYALTNNKLVKNKFKVAGVVVNGVGYGAATNKKLKPIGVTLMR